MLAVIRHEVVLRIFRRDAALQRVAVERDLVLLRQVDRRLVQLVALRDQNLAAHEVDAGHHLGDGVLHLDARIHFDEVELAAYRHPPGTQRCRRCSSRPRARAAARHRPDRFANLFGQIDGGRDFHYFLMPPLHGAIALVQMQDVAVAVAQDLHFDVLARAG